ncbi:hypothetical protein D3C79_887060 [compost metagenome]
MGQIAEYRAPGLFGSGTKCHHVAQTAQKTPAAKTINITNFFKGDKPFFMAMVINHPNAVFVQAISQRGPQAMAQRQQYTAE